jgi:FAD/FMN-containing dehydrogenase
MTADWRALQEALDGDVVLPGSPEYESLRKPVMARFEHVRPAAVVLCATPADVAATLAVAGRLGLRTAIRSGGHSVAGRSATDGVVLDVTPMGSVAVAGDGTTVGAGVRLGELYDALANHGLTIPAGCGPSVGIAGLTLGGGLGILGRKHGLTCDHLLRAQVVLADVAWSTATSTTTGSCSGRCVAPAAATSAWSPPSPFAPSPRPRPRSST